MTEKKISFKRIYLIYLGILAALVVGALVYVYVLLRQYEDAQPERRVWQVVEELSAMAADGTLLTAYDIPRVAPGAYEQGVDVTQAYLELYGDREALSVVRGTSASQGDVLTYQVERDGVVLARVGLRPEGEAVTKLAVFSMQNWVVDFVRPELEPHDYTCTLPAAFAVELNGVPLAGAAGESGKTTYAVSGLYLPPDFSITDGTDAQAQYTIRDGQVLVEYVDYTLTLPGSLAVQVNGETWPGQAQGQDRVRYEIALLNQPEVVISDYYGNTVTYAGGDTLPLTSCTITADERCTVEVDGAPVPEEAIVRSANPDYQHFTDYVEGLPEVCVYSVAVLRDGAQVTAADAQGNPMALEEGRTSYDLTAPAGTDQVPEEVSGEIDVLRVAQDWSLFMSDDLSFSRIDDYLIPSSYQYEVARKYATGVDITFTSAHTLADPAFTDSEVSNFAWITEDCFSVDIRFVKHMRLRSGAMVDDPMNDRFYFVRYDDTDDGADNPAWKLASMKEILNDADE